MSSQLQGKDRSINIILLLYYIIIFILCKGCQWRFIITHDGKLTKCHQLQQYLKLDDKIHAPNSHTRGFWTTETIECRSRYHERHLVQQLTERTEH